MSSVRPEVKRILFAWLAVSLLILSTACSRMTAQSFSLPVQPAAAPQPVVPGEQGGEADPPAGDPANHIDNDEVAGQQPFLHELEGESGTPSQESLTTGIGQERLPIEIVDYDPRGKNPDQVFPDGHKISVYDLPEGQTVLEPLPGDIVDHYGEAGPRLMHLARGDTGEPLYYSGSGQDRLYEEIKELTFQEPDIALRDSNLAFAQRVGFTTFEVNWRTRRALLTVNIDNGQSLPTAYRFEGRLDNQLRFRSGQLDAAPFIEVDAVCMDLKGGCNTTHVRVRQNNGASTNTAHVLARHTKAAIFSQGNPKHASRNAEYDRFVHILTTSVHFPGGANSIESLYLTTSETINGSSDFAFAMSMRMSVMDPEYGQVLVWRGPLVRPISTDAVSLPVHAHSDYTIYGRRRHVSQPIASTFRESRLIRNDGRGNMQIEVTFRKATPAAQEDTVRLTVARIHEPTRALILE